MTRTRKAFALTSTAALLAVPVIGFTAVSASADVDRNGTCAGVPFEFSVDREDGAYEVSVDLDRAKVGSSWRIQLAQNGTSYSNQVLRADREGDVEVESYRPNTAGADKFRVTITEVSSGTACSRTIKTR